MYFGSSIRKLYYTYFKRSIGNLECDFLCKWLKIALGLHNKHLSGAKREAWSMVWFVYSHMNLNIVPLILVCLPAFTRRDFPQGRGCLPWEGNPACLSLGNWRAWAGVGLWKRLHLEPSSRALPWGRKPGLLPGWAMPRKREQPDVWRTQTLVVLRSPPIWMLVFWEEKDLSLPPVVLRSWSSHIQPLLLRWADFLLIFTMWNISFQVEGCRKRKKQCHSIPSQIWWTTECFLGHTRN